MLLIQYLTQQLARSGLHLKVDLQLMIGLLPMNIKLKKLFTIIFHVAYGYQIAEILWIRNIGTL